MPLKASSSIIVSLGIDSLISFGEWMDLLLIFSSVLGVVYLVCLESCGKQINSFCVLSYKTPSWVENEGFDK